MTKRTMLERRAFAFLKGACKGLRNALNERYENPNMFNVVLEMYRKIVEQTWLALTDDLNILGTAQEYGFNPRVSRLGGNRCILHFQACAGELFRREFEAGVR